MIGGGVGEAAAKLRRAPKPFAATQASATRQIAGSLAPALPAPAGEPHAISDAMRYFRYLDLTPLRGAALQSWAAVASRRGGQGPRGARKLPATQHGLFGGNGALQGRMPSGCSPAKQVEASLLRIEPRPRLVTQGALTLRWAPKPHLASLKCFGPPLARSQCRVNEDFLRHAGARRGRRWSGAGHPTRAADLPFRPLTGFTQPIAPWVQSSCHVPRLAVAQPAGSTRPSVAPGLHPKFGRPGVWTWNLDEARPEP